MRYTLVVTVTLAGLVWGGRAHAQSAEAHVAKIDPCKLVTKEELQKEIEASLHADDLARYKSRGAVWSITTESVTHGDSRDCSVAWSATVKSELLEKNEFSVSVATAEWLQNTVASIKKPPVAIPGVGSGVWYLGGGTRSPYTRVGDLAVGIQDGKGQPAIDLLRAALARVH
jgi:hypothetical protein